MPNEGRPPVRDASLSPTASDTADELMDLEAFLDWCQCELQLSFRPNPSDDFRKDLNIDDVQLFLLIHRLSEQETPHAVVGPAVFEKAISVRDLFLYYMMISSAPER